jgi:hypothetical protein
MDIMTKPKETEFLKIAMEKGMSGHFWLSDFYRAGIRPIECLV